MTEYKELAARLRTVEDRLTMPVLSRYVRRLLSDSDRAYREWCDRERSRLALQENTNGG